MGERRPVGQSFFRQDAVRDRQDAVRLTGQFASWLRSLWQLGAKSFVQARIERIICGNPGDVRPVGARPVRPSAKRQAPVLAPR